MYANIQFTKPFCFGEKFVTLESTAHAKNQYFCNICAFSNMLKFSLQETVIAFQKLTKL